MANYGTILVVDDNTSIFTTLEICLDGVFDRILTLTKPENILTTLEQKAVDIILLDMNFSLGVNNGQDGLLWVQAVHRRHPDIPIVLMTAYADVKIAVKGLKSGAVDFVTKPWDNHELVRVLKDAIDANTEVVPLEKMGATDKPCGGGLSTLTQNRCQTIHEERNVPDSFYLCSETFYL